MTAPFRLRDDGVEMFVRLTPKTAMDRLEGIEISADGPSYLKARVRALRKTAPPIKRSNGWSPALGVPRSAVSVVVGGTARLKMLRVLGDPAALARGIKALSSA
jgi:uncharacterized protein YggU (UPF0235/DUF167 family)